MEVFIAQLYQSPEGVRCDIKGTGLLLSNGLNYYVVTCRHVIEPLMKTGQILMVPNCKTYVIPRDVEKESVVLTQPKYHPNDKDTSYDIAVFQLENIDIPIEKKPYELGVDSTNSSLSIGDEIIFSGYPVAYLHEKYSPEQNAPLPPISVGAKIAKVPLHQLTLSNFSKGIKGFEFAQTFGDLTVSSGMSGGAVLFENKLVGLVVGSVNASISNEAGMIYPIIGGAFVPFDKVYETIAQF